jgi:phosphatidylinositol alpha-1,6-mannosyltransferase
MKIGLVSAEFPPEGGGVQTYAWEYAHELARRGHEVVVFTQPHSGGEAATTALRIEPVLRLRRRFDREVFRREKVDVWHALNAAYSWMALEFEPVFVTVHGNDFVCPYQPVARLDLRERLHLPYGSNLDHRLGGWLTRRLMARALPRAARIFTNSKFTERRFLGLHPDCAGRTTPAMVGVSAHYFARPKPPRRSGPPRLLTVCRLAEKNKNVDLVLRALATLKASWPFHYTIVGGGELLEPLRALAQTLELGDRVTFTGFIPQPELHDHLLDSDLFILTTSANERGYEGFGLVYLEANACGCPTVAARLGGATEAVSEGRSGMFVADPVPEAIAATVLRFLSHEVHFESSACIEFARSFSWSAVAEVCLDFYLRTCA